MSLLSAELNSALCIGFNYSLFLFGFDQVNCSRPWVSYIPIMLYNSYHQQPTTPMSSIFMPHR